MEGNLAPFSKGEESKLVTSTDQNNGGWKASIHHRLCRLEILFMLATVSAIFLFLPNIISNYHKQARFYDSLPNEIEQRVMARVDSKILEIMRELDFIRSTEKSEDETKQKFTQSKKNRSIAVESDIKNFDVMDKKEQMMEFLFPAVVNRKAVKSLKMSTKSKLILSGRFPTRQLKVEESPTSCNDSIFWFHTNLQALDVATNLQLRDDTSGQMLEIFLSTNETSNFMKSFFACVSIGIYSFDIVREYESKLPCDEFEMCYQVLVNNELIIQGDSFLERASHNFYVSRAGAARERFCHKLPILSALSSFGNLAQDDRIQKILNKLNSISSFDSLHSHKSAQYKAACWIIFDDELELSVDSAYFVERYALAIYLISFNVPAELAMSRSNCNLPGISCDNKGFVRGIETNGQTQVKTIPSELSLLQNLETISFSSSQFEGTLPTELGRLRELKKLDVSQNNLTGTIPTEIGHCTKLQHLWLFQNNLRGSIPWEIFDCKLLVWLQLFENQLTGTIPTSINQARKLELIDFWGNSLSGQIPSELWESQSLIWLYLNDNRLTGSVPEDIENVQTLSVVFFHNNMLTGTLPDVFATLQSLSWLDISQNNFSGFVPDSLWNHSSFELLHLRNNHHLQGIVPPDFCPSSPQRFKVDDTSWFLDKPKIDCKCCGTPTSCQMWNIEDRFMGEIPRPPCLTSNIVTTPEFFFSYFTRDRLANGTLTELVGLVFRKVDLCLSPTGCYNIEYFIDESRITTTSYNLSYSALSKSLVIQDECDTVEICGTSFHSNHPRRIALNHLTQVAVPDFATFDNPSKPKYKALCWIMVEDPLFANYKICDGSLLQRYVLALFFISQTESVYDFDKFSSNPTCKWPDVICDSKNHFVKEVSFSNANLHGSIITEIGLLATLESIDFSQNSLTGSIVTEMGQLSKIQSLKMTSNQLRGTIDPVTFEHTLKLKSVDIGHNRLGGSIPKELLELPQLREVNLMNNTLVGTLPRSISYSKNLQHFDLGQNLLQGRIPDALFECNKLTYVNLAHNGFFGQIPSIIGNLKKLQTIHLDQNQLSGSIPIALFDVEGVHELMLHSNKLTGSIPTLVGRLENASRIFMNHNQFKGNLPTELANLTNLEGLHLHQNQLTGIAPDVIFRKQKRENYIADCADPSYLLPNPLECATCTMCCNSNDECQDKNYWKIPVWATTIIWVITFPIIASFFRYVITIARKRTSPGQWIDERDSTTIYSQDSVYCLILSSDPRGWLIYLMTAAIQIGLFSIFLKASSDATKDSDYKFSFLCSSSSETCSNQNAVDLTGRLLFFICIIIFLGTDFVMGLLQIHRSILYKDTRMFLSGLGLFSLSMLALVTSFVYNDASGQRNTDMIKDAVVLLFFTDLDECLMKVLFTICPVWTNKQLENIKTNITNKSVRWNSIVSPNINISRISKNISSAETPQNDDDSNFSVSENTDHVVVLSDLDYSEKNIEQDDGVSAN